MAEIIPSTKNILVVAGDPSGDLHGAALIRALKKQDPDINVAVLGGERMREVSDRFIYNLAGIGAAGFAEPLLRFFLWIRLIGLIRKYMDEKRPACVVTIDFYGFNHQVLGLAAHRKIPAFYYVSPQVWASRPTRALRLARLVRRMLVIFPFEKAVYEKAGAACTFVGHPLLDIVPEPITPPENRGRDYAWKVGILPGSRAQEISRHMPLFWEAFTKVKATFPQAKPYIFAAREVSDATLLALCRKQAGRDVSSEVSIVRESDYAMRKTMDIVVTSSGTATLENAMLGIPMVVVYKMPWFTYQIAKRVVTVPYISLVNILAGKPLVKELIQEKATADALSGQMMALINNPSTMTAMRQSLIALRKTLGEPGVANRAAEIITTEVFPK